MYTYSNKYLTNDGNNYYWRGVKIELDNEAAYTEDDVSKETWEEVQLAKKQHGIWTPAEADDKVLVTLYIPIKNSEEISENDDIEWKEVVIKEEFSKEFYFNHDGQDLDYFDFENLNNIKLKG